MKVETSVEKLLFAIESTDRVTVKNSSLPILSTILLVAANNGLKIRATNLSLGVEFNIPVKTHEEGVIAVEGKILVTFLNTLNKNEKITIYQKDTSLIIETKNNKTKIKTHPYEDFPTLPSVKGDSFIIQSKELIKGFKSTVFAAAISEVKPEIASVYMYSEGDTLFFASTDSFRLSEKKEILKKPLSIEPILIPSKNITEIIRIYEDNNKEITCVVNENQITLESEGVYITSRIVSGSFPDYKQIIPKEYSTQAIILKQDLITLLKKANIFSDKFNQINLSISPTKKRFECFSQNSNTGEFSGDIDASLSGDDVTVSVNHKYLMDCINYIPQDSISIQLNGSNKALVVQGVSDQTFTYLLMPMNR